MRAVRPRGKGAAAVPSADAPACGLRWRLPSDDEPRREDASPHGCRSRREAAAAGGLRVPPDGAAYTGAYVDFGDGEDHVTFPAIEKFERLVGKHQAIIGSSSFWGRGKFPTKTSA